jgi:hypothetical protein
VLGGGQGTVAGVGRRQGCRGGSGEGEWGREEDRIERRVCVHLSHPFKIQWMKNSCGGALFHPCEL